jgi:hypothetical protein
VERTVKREIAEQILADSRAAIARSREQIARTERIIAQHRALLPRLREAEAPRR